MSLFKKLFGGSGKVTFRRTLRQADGNTYDVYAARTRRDALDFLRQHEVKEERRYAIVETPEGNVGKGFIMMFEERSGAMIELAERRPLRRPRKSTSHCCRCGYPVIPLGRSSPNEARVGALYELVVLSEMKKQGTGFVCSECHALCCAICASPPDSPACPLCREKLEPYRE